MANVDELIARETARMQDHLARYLKNGEDGHLFDTSHLGGSVDTTTLIIRTTGRKSGNLIRTPLIYVKYRDEYAIAASKGGADEHPAWYLNLIEKADVAFKVVNDCYEGSWREVHAEDREDVWAALLAHYKPYDDYRQKSKRTIPVILLKPIKKIDAL